MPKRSETKARDPRTKTTDVPKPPANFFYRSVELDSDPDRAHEDILLRRVPTAMAHQFRGAAGARGMTHAQYLVALLKLHATIRQRADGGHQEMRALLGELGLMTVSI